MFASYRTTIVGIAVLLMASGQFLKALFDGDPATVPDLDAFLIALGGVGFLVARDNKTSSQDAGVR